MERDGHIYDGPSVKEQIKNLFSPPFLFFWGGGEKIKTFLFSLPFIWDRK